MVRSRPIAIDLRPFTLVRRSISNRHVLGWCYGQRRGGIGFCGGGVIVDELGMPFPPSRLSQTFSADDDPELDEIIARAGPSEEEFLAPHTSAPSSPLRRAKEPIPANRMALLRQIEEENLQLRRRQRLRSLGYKAVMVISIVTFLAIASILFWLLYLAFIENPRQMAAVRRGEGLRRVYPASGRERVKEDGHRLPRPHILGTRKKTHRRLTDIPQLKPRMSHYKPSAVRAGEST